MTALVPVTQLFGYTTALRRAQLGLRARSGYRHLVLVPVMARARRESALLMIDSWPDRLSLRAALGGGSVVYR